MYQFREFIRGAVAANTPADEFARRVLTARGGPADDPASGYFAASKDANETVERVTQVFCGVRMLCARCHSHPLENWTQADYFGVASFFTQVAVRPDARTPGVPNSKLIALNLAAGPATNPRTGKAQPPRFLGGAEPTLPARRPPRRLRRVADGPAEPVLRPRPRQPRVELLLPPRHHRPGGRHPQHQPADQPRVARRPRPTS